MDARWLRLDSVQHSTVILHICDSHNSQEKKKTTYCKIDDFEIRNKKFLMPVFLHGFCTKITRFSEKRFNIQS